MQEIGCILIAEFEIRQSKKRDDYESGAFFRHMDHNFFSSCLTWSGSVGIIFLPEKRQKNPECSFGSVSAAFLCKSNSLCGILDQI